VSASINVKAGVRLRGSGFGSTILKSTAGASSAPIVQIIGSNASVEDLTIDANNRTTSSGLVANFSSAGANIAVRRCTIKNAAANCIRVQGTAQVAGMVFEGNTFDTCGGGLQIYSVTGQVQKDITIRNNRWTAVSANQCQLVGNNQHEFNNCVVSGNIMRDYGGVGVGNGPIPYELNRCDGLTVSHNYVGSTGTRGIGISQSYNVSVTGNTVVGQSLYAMEVGNQSDVVISGNAFIDCAEWIDVTSATFSDATISGNLMSGSGQSVLDSSRSGLKLDNCARVTVSGNSFVDFPYGSSIVKVGNSGVASDVLIADNMFVISSANTLPQGVGLRKCIRTTVRGNSFRILRNLATPGPPDDDINDVIQITTDASSADIIVEGNDFAYSGTFGTVTNHACIGHGSTGASANPPRVTIRRNKAHGTNYVRGMRLSSFTDVNLIVEDNDFRGGLTADSFNAATVYKRTVRIMSGAAAPTTGTWVRGDKVVNDTAAVGSPKGWVCVTSGSPGTWNTEGNL